MKKTDSYSYVNTTFNQLQSPIYKAFLKGAAGKESFPLRSTHLLAIEEEAGNRYGRFSVNYSVTKMLPNICGYL